jgi:hypothetical protein
MLLVLVAVAGLSLGGCSKKEEPTPTPPAVPADVVEEAEEAVEEAQPAAEEAAKDAEKALGDLQE